MDILRQLDAVAQGRIGYTVADSTEFALAHDVNPQLRIASDFGGRESLAWAASERDPGFVRAMNGYFGRINLDGELTAIVHRYYGRAERVEFGESEVFLHHLQSRLPRIGSGSRRLPNRAARIGGCWRPLVTRNRSGTRVPPIRRVPGA